jgi:hypothetical protein
MIFDLLAKFIESNEPDSVDDISRLHLFEFPYRSHDVLHTGMFAQEDLDAFTLPFSSIAIEDETSCVVLEDTEDRQVGCDMPRRFIDVVPIKHDEVRDERVPESEVREMIELGMHQIAFGTIGHVSSQGRDKDSEFLISSHINALVFCDKKGNIITALSQEELESSPHFQEARSGIIGNVSTAIEELLLVQQDTTLFVLEKSPLKPRRIGKSRIARSQDRNRYILLRPDAIRKQMQVKHPTAETGTTKRPHERRRHWRTLKSERFKNKRGQKILIDAVWVGPKESVVGKTRYRVRLDV